MVLNPYRLLAGLADGLGCACAAGRPGLGSSSDVTAWPESRKQGLTFGELAEIASWLRNRLLPPVYPVQVTVELPGGGFAARQVGRAVAWYSGSAHYAAMNAGATLPAVNEFGETAGQALYRAVQRFEALPEPVRRATGPAFGHWLKLWGLAGNVSDGVYRDRQPRNGAISANWPVQVAQNRPDSVLNHLRAFGLDAWWRLVAALAIGRDLFAEDFRQVGGVQLGLQDKLEDLQQTGVAVSGRWEPLAGRWVWKGWDLSGRPLLVSDPILPPPQYPPQEREFVLGRNASIWRYMFALPGVDYGPAVRQFVPALTRQFNAVAPLAREATIPEPPPTAAALAELFTRLWNLLGLDVYRMMVTLGGEDFANVIRDAAQERFPVAGSGPLFETPAFEQPHQPQCSAEYAPVLGADGRTYTNACQAAASGVAVVREA